MFNKLSAVICLLLFALALSGCSDDKGQGFVGRWTGENIKRMGKPSFVMDISKDGEIFHINLETTDDILGHGKREKSMQMFEAKADADSVLSIACLLYTSPT
ncbi:hypothetical protein, partial [Pseudomonas syringae pv. coryli]